MSEMASPMSRRGPRSPAALRKAAGTSLVADIGRKSITSLAGPRAALQEPVDEAVARTAPRGTQLPGDERVVPGEVEPIPRDRVDHPGRVGHLGPDHVGP